jgi:hypothetical protein
MNRKRILNKEQARPDDPVGRGISNDEVVILQSSEFSIPRPNGIQPGGLVRYS